MGGPPLIFNTTPFSGCCGHPRDSEHLDDVHEGIGQPRDDGQPTSVRRQGSNRWGMLLGSCTQAHGQLCNDVEEWKHGKEPPHPPATCTVLDLTWVAQSHHGC